MPLMPLSSHPWRPVRWPRVEGFPQARSTVYTAPETGALLGESCLWPDGSAFYYLDPSLVPESVARAYLTEVANLMGCDTIEEMEEHEAWLASYREHSKSVRAVAG